jgi:hypothetical protein
MPERTIPGTPRQHERPVWQPLVDLISEDLAEWFMWMFELELEDGTPVHAYKHVATRRYFHLSEDGRAFAYLPGGDYEEIASAEAIDEAFAGWDELLPQPSDPEAVRVAIQRARSA